eukprot:COSAG02_NODE_3000_length_7578_cov_218.918305_3_plen_62_part_00
MSGNRRRSGGAPARGAGVAAPYLGEDMTPEDIGVFLEQKRLLDIVNPKTLRSFEQAIPGSG